MSEKPTLRQIGEQAADNIADLKDASLARSHNKLGSSLEGSRIRRYDERLQKHAEDDPSTVNLKDARQKSAARLGELIADRARILEDERAADEKATAHYRDNQEAYHDLALLEATGLDGVHIEVQQQPETEQHIDVRLAG